MTDYHIYSIPIWEAYDKQSECAFCDIESTLTAKYLENALGAGMMESDFRIETNRLGFCAPHLHALSTMQGVHALSLVLHTHLQDIIEQTDLLFASLQTAIQQEDHLPAHKKIIQSISHGGSLSHTIESTCDSIESRNHSCHICKQIDHHMVRYADTLLHMWKTESKFKDCFASSKGLCMKHLPGVLQAASKGQTGAVRSEFLHTLLVLQKENLHRIEEELSWFTLKFDYRNADKPWGNSQDAVPRTIQKLRGIHPSDTL